MPTPSEDLRTITTFKQLTKYLRDQLDWPIDDRFEFEELTYAYQPEELGLKSEEAVKIREVQQLRPLTTTQPWGIFFVDFEKKRLPVVLLRKILRHLVIKKRASGNKHDIKQWAPKDLLFISAYGESSDRALTFAHFVEHSNTNLAELRVLGWDDDDTPLHMDYVAGMLQQKLRWDSKIEKNPELWRSQWSEAFVLGHRHVVSTSEELAAELAKLARRIRNRIRTLLRSEDGFGEMRKLMRAFKDGLIHDLDDEGFADMFAQTVTYGLFSLACRRTVPGAGTAFAKEDLTTYFTSPFLREMLGIFLGLKSRKGAIDFDELGVSDVTDLLTSPDTHMEVVLADFNNKTRGEDPVIHFYEHFLTAYNKQLKIQRGVFYTAQPVVSYIVRSVHELLQTEFGLADGLADTTTWGEMLIKHPGLKLPPLTDEPGEKRTISPDEMFVQILDPATGTATFLVEVIEVIYLHLKGRWAKGGLAAIPMLPGVKTGHCKQFTEYWNHYVPSALLPRLHAFELMMAPYAIAHMKIGLKLAETGYRFGTEERARIYLTNALEPKVKQLPQIGFDALAHEAAAVNEIKWYKRFTVVIGNPPYAGTSSNFGPWISSLVNDYYFVEGKPLGERNPKYLQDDYVKFIRLGQHLLHQTGRGIFSFITNHGYITNPTFRGMRHSLLQEFDCWQTLDLHGSAKRKEQSNDGRADENVFDIQQGVAVFQALKTACSGRTISHADLYGNRANKYDALRESCSKRIQWQTVSSVAPFYLFQPQDADVRGEYYGFTSIADLMPLKNYGFKTHRDDFSVSFTEEELESRLAVLRANDLSNKELLEKFSLSETVDWKIANIRQVLRANKNWKTPILKCIYRPFDYRFCYLSNEMMDRPRFPFMHQMLAPNIALATTRTVEIQRGFEHVGCVAMPMDHHAVSLKESNFLFPLYVYPTGGELSFATERHANFAPAILKLLCSKLDLKFADGNSSTSGVTPEDIFHYVYAVFHSPGYRSRYAEFLKIDFPRLPLTGSLELFRALSSLGGELVALHLLESPKLNKACTEFVGERKQEVEKVSWQGNTVWIDKAQTTGFKGVPEAVWNFNIGGYQVCEKWLKDRKGRTLTKDDLTHYGKIVIALGETIRLMKETDEVIAEHGGWPGAFVSINS